MSNEIFQSDDKKVKLLSGLQQQQQQMRLVTSETRQINQQYQPTIEIQQSKYKMQIQDDQQIIQTQYLPQQRIQSQKIIRQNISIPQINQYSGSYSVQQNCQQAPPLCMNIVVVSKEEIEAPWRLECEYLQSIIADLERRKEAKVIEKEVVKVVTDNTKIEQLELLLKQQKNENEQLQFQLMQLRSNYENQLEQLRGDITLHSANAIDTQSLQAEFFQMRTQLEDQISILQRQITDLQLQINQLQTENDRLRQLLQNKDQEIQQLRIQLQQLQTSAQDTSKLRDLENQLKLSKDENIRLEKQLQQLNQDLINWKNKYTLIEQESYTKNNELIMQLRDYENKLLVLTTEIERMSTQLKIKDSELEEWQFKYTQLESQGTTVIQEKVTYLSQEVEVWKQKFIKANHEYNKCQEELTMCQAELESLKKSQSKREVVVTQSKVITSRSGNTLTVTGPTGSQSTIRRQQQQQE